MSGCVELGSSGRKYLFVWLGIPPFREVLISDGSAYETPLALIIDCFAYSHNDKQACEMN